MEWNDMLDQLNYYLANLYITDTANLNKIAIAQRAKCQVFAINFNQTPVLVWFQIIRYAAERNKVDKLVEAVLAEPQNADDEFLKGILKNLNEGKTVVSKDLPDAQWKGGGTVQLTKQKIMGKKSNLLPIGFLEKGAEKARAIVRVVYNTSAGTTSGTGFVIEKGWLITNNHVLPNRETAATAEIQFNYQFPKNLKTADKNVSEIKPERVASLDPGTENDKRFFTDAALDFTIVKIKDADLGDYGFLQLAKGGVRADDFVNIIQHPSGGPKQIGIYNNLVMYADESIVQYMTDTAEGSSGSPVLNSDWEVVALHHSGGWLTDPDTNETVRRNQGTNIKQLAQFIIDHKLNGE
jgi:V8-like Glu-specific endopeptidase